VLAAPLAHPVAALCGSVFSHPSLRLPAIAALRMHDADHGSELVATLGAYLDAFGNVATAAGRLGVHVNTFRYRLRRVVELSRLDLGDADVRLVCALQLAAPPAPLEPGLPHHVDTAVVLHAVTTAARAWPDLDGGAVTRLATHDKARRTAYVESLRSYLATFGDVPAAAAAVYVHPRTFRYRLRRIEDLGGIRLDDPLTRLAVELELRVTR